MELIVKPDLLVQFETIFGALLYLFGVAGSYYRFEKHERRGKIDSLLMVCFTFGYCAIMVSLLRIAKYTLIPTIHLEIVRVLYYSGAFVSSLVFFAKEFRLTKKFAKIATFLILGPMVFIAGEGLVFYLEIPYQSAIFSCVGILVFYFASFIRRNSLAASLAGLAMIALPIHPKLKEQKLDLQQMNAKREAFISHLGKEKEPLRFDNDEQIANALDN